MSTTDFIVVVRGGCKDFALPQKKGEHSLEPAVGEPGKRGVLDRMRLPMGHTPMCLPQDLFPGTFPEVKHRSGAGARRLLSQRFQQPHGGKPPILVP